MLNERLKNIGSCLPLSGEVYNSVWENVAHLITHTLVEGYVLLFRSLLIHRSTVINRFIIAASATPRSVLTGAEH